MRKILEVQNLFFKYPTSRNWVLRGINLAIYEGEFLGITGPSGAGKTTLAMTFNGLIPHYVGGRMKGRVIVAGHDTRKTSIGDLSRVVQVIFNDANSQLVMSTVLEELVVPLVNNGFGHEDAVEVARAALKKFGISYLEDRPPQLCSGGEKQRILLAMVSALRPKIVVVDEAMSDLDPETVKMVFEYLDQMRNEGNTVVVISSDMEHLVEMADRIIVLLEGRVLKEGSPREVVSDRTVVEKAGLRIPQVSELAHALSEVGVVLNDFPITLAEAEKHLRVILSA